MAQDNNKEEEEAMEDLVDFNDDDLFDNESKSVETNPSPSIVAQSSTTTEETATPKSSSQPTKKSGGWKQFNSGQQEQQQQQQQPEPTRKREKLTFDLPSRSSNGSDSNVFSTILVSKLPSEVKISKLALHFESFGTVNEIFLDRAQNRGLVRFSHPVSAQSAIQTPFQIYNHRMVLDRVKEPDLAGNNNTLAELASTIFTALEAKQHGLDHPVITLTVEHIECSTKPAVSALPQKMTYRAPEALEDAAKPKIDPAVQREIQKANLKVLVEEKNVAIAKKTLASVRDGMKQAKDKLGQIANNPSQRSEIIAEVTSFTIESKNAQATVIQAESKLQAAKRELERLKAIPLVAATAPAAAAAAVVPTPTASPSPEGTAAPQ